MKRFAILDGLRGYFLVFMMLNHLPFQGELLLARINHSELGYVQDAQGFVFISGVIIGLYYTRMIAKGQTSLMDAKILNRAYELYVYAVIVLAVVLFLAVLVPNSRPLWGHFMWEMYQTPTLTGVSAFLLLYQPTFMDILPQYIVYLVASPLLLRWVARGYWREVLGASVLLWLMVQLGLHLPAIRIVEETVGAYAPGFVLRGHFNPLGWQVVFVTGLLLGAADARGELDWDRWFSPRRTDLLKVSIALVLLFMAFRLGFTNGLVPDSMALRFDVYNNRGEFALVYLLNFAGLAYLVAWLLVAGREASSPVARTAGVLLNRLFNWRFLTFIGKHSLQVYAYHVVVVYVILGFDGRIGPFTEGTKTAITLLAIASLLVPAWIHASYATWMDQGGRLAPQPRTAAEGPTRN
ncbi:OpgC domain-containing protein [Skermanella rosea]|uniref:OpgC family protein n=1 Tax=Skermanella rosea TaxID=1817965 RepID=UPI001932AEF1|nr:OpgC domain-containing protein [Skermanella rosea]UEM02910.1 OpgC domain-containing protein [Skermanella rosea]